MEHQATENYFVKPNGICPAGFWPCLGPMSPSFLLISPFERGISTLRPPHHWEYLVFHKWKWIPWKWIPCFLVSQAPRRTGFAPINHTLSLRGQDLGLFELMTFEWDFGFRVKAGTVTTFEDVG